LKESLANTDRASTTAIPNANLDDGVIDIAMRKVAERHQRRELKERGMNVVLMRSAVSSVDLHKN
jgi:hypothetical protein